MWSLGAVPDPETALRDLRRDIRIEVFNEVGHLAMAWQVFRCWASEFSARADLDANANAVVIEHL